jgi:hypothetical protein
VKAKVLGVEVSKTKNHHDRRTTSAREVLSIINPEVATD